MPRKYTRKQLKRPDEFLTLSMRIWAYAKEHLPYVLLSVGVAAVLVAGVWTWDYFSTRRGEQSTAQITRATDIYTQTIVPMESKVPPTDEDGVPRFKTRADKLKAAEEEYSKVVNGGGSIAVAARGMRAGVRYDAGKYQEAAEDYQKVLGSTDDSRIRSVALEGLGYCHEALRDYDKALQQFRLLPHDGDRKYLALYHEARVLAKKGAVKEAVELYKQIISKGSPASLVDRASDRLALLEAK